MSLFYLAEFWIINVEENANALFAYNSMKHGILVSINTSIIVHWKLIFASRWICGFVADFIERPSELYWGPFFLVFTLSFLKGRLYLGASGATDPEPSKPWSFTSKIGYFSMKLPFILVLNFTSMFLPKSNVVQWKKCEGYFSCSPVHIWIYHINTWPTQLCAFI